MTGSGTEADPFIIQNVTDLQAIENNLGSYYELEGDINASDTSSWNASAGFDPIINFTGQLDGKGSTISDLFINRPTEAYVGLIGYTNASIVLKNINMTGVDITGQTNVGALLGYDNGGGTPDIDNCNSAGTVTASNGQVGGLVGVIKGGAIDDCWSSCTITNGSDGSRTGGLIGWNDNATITQCYATGAVTSSDQETGGLIGRTWDGAISKCYAKGNVSGVGEVGGLIGYNEQAPVDDCYARGNADATTDYYAGGLIGRNSMGVIDDCYSTGTASTVDDSLEGGLIGENFGTVTNCFWDTETSGNATSDGGTGKTTAQMKTSTIFTGAGWDFTDIWGISTGQNSGYPYLQWAEVLVGELSSLIAIVQTKFHYVDAFGDERGAELPLINP